MVKTEKKLQKPYVTEGIHKTFKIKFKDCECCLEYKNVKDNFIEYKCLCCNRNYQKTSDGNLKRGFANTYRFANHDINEFIFFCWEKVFRYMSTLTIMKSLMKNHYQKKKVLQSFKHGRYY